NGLLACFLASLVACPALGQESAPGPWMLPARERAKDMKYGMEPVMPKLGEVRPWEPGEPVGVGLPVAGYWVPAMAYPPGGPPVAAPCPGWHGPPGVGAWSQTSTIRTGLFGCACVRPSLQHLKDSLHSLSPPCPCPAPYVETPPWAGAYYAATHAAGAAVPAPAAVPVVTKEKKEPRRMPPAIDRTASLRRPSAPAAPD